MCDLSCVPRCGHTGRPGPIRRRALRAPREGVERAREHVHQVGDALHER